MPARYRSCDVFLHMSREEPFGIVYLEAAAVGLPVVADDNRITRWILENEGVLVATSDPSEVTAGVRGALADRNESSVERRRKMIVDRFSWKGIARQYLGFFQEVLSASLEV